MKTFAVLKMTGDNDNDWPIGSLKIETDWRHLNKRVASQIRPTIRTTHPILGDACLTFCLDFDMVVLVGETLPPAWIVTWLQEMGVRVAVTCGTRLEIDHNELDAYGRADYLFAPGCYAGEDDNYDEWRQWINDIQQKTGRPLIGETPVADLTQPELYFRIGAHTTRDELGEGKLEYEVEAALALGCFGLGVNEGANMQLVNRLIAVYQDHPRFWVQKARSGELRWTE